MLNAEEGHALFHICNSLVLSKGLLYVSTTPKGEAEGILAFLVPIGHYHVALNGVHCDMRHIGPHTRKVLVAHDVGGCQDLV